MTSSEILIVIFSYSKLEKFFRYIKNHYDIWIFSEWNESPGIILRHDVDFSLIPAYDLSQIEKKHGINSTFFVMVTSLTYNPLTKDNRKLIQNMASDGFEIGLHFDPSVYKTNDKNIIYEKMKKETEILSSIIENKINSISIHNPSVHGQYPQFKDFKNAYDPKIFSKDVYLSDSQMTFSKDIYNFVKSAKNKTLQLLLHPLYYTKNGDSIGRIFVNQLKNHIKSIDCEY